MDISKLKSIVRRLTPLECERLMGFPDGYLDIGDNKGGRTPDSPMYKACGNSWGVNSARWVNSRIEKVLRETGIVGDRSPHMAECTAGYRCNKDAHSRLIRRRNIEIRLFKESFSRIRPEQICVTPNGAVSFRPLGKDERRANARNGETVADTDDATTAFRRCEQCGEVFGTVNTTRALCDGCWEEICGRLGFDYNGRSNVAAVATGRAK